MAKDVKNSVDLTQLAQEFEKKSSSMIDHFNQFVKNISPNRIDLNKVKSIQVGGKALSDYVKAGSILISQDGPRGAKIDSIDGNVNLSKFVAGLIDAGFQAIDRGGPLFITMQPMTEDMRKEMCKQVRELKEKTKQSMNDIRADMNKVIKASGESEDVRRRASDAIDKVKDKLQHALEKTAQSKESEVMSG